MQRGTSGSQAKSRLKPRSGSLALACRARRILSLKANPQKQALAAPALIAFGFQVRNLKSSRYGTLNSALFQSYVVVFCLNQHCNSA